MSRPTAGDRARRLLAIVPWVAARGGVEVEEICERFDIERDQLLADLETLWFVGTPPYTPADLMEVDIEDDRVSIRYADAFRAPLRLTPEQGLALVAAGASLRGTIGADPTGPLERGLGKFERALGVEGRIDVDLGSASAAVLDVLRQAAAAGDVVEIDYWSFGRDERRRRRVEPAHVVVDRGTWYLQAHCQAVDAPRTFRVDRIHEAVVTGERFAPAADEPRSVAAFGPGDGEAVVLDLTPAARWVVEQHPCEVLEAHDDGSQRISLVVSAPAYLERLLLQLGGDAQVVRGAHGVAAAAAQRVLQRYRTPI